MEEPKAPSLSAIGARIEVPKVLRGVPLPTGSGVCPLPQKF